MMLATPAAAMQLAVPNVCGTLIGFGVSYAVAAAACGGGRTEQPTPGAARLLHSMNNENIPRTRTLGVALCTVMALITGGAGAGISMPSFAEQVVYAMWFAMMAMVDEFYDTLPLLNAANARPPQHLQAICWGLLLLPIPYLLAAQDVYKLFALQFVGSQIMGSKLDLPEFKAAVALGLPIVALIAWQSGVALSGMSLVGMAVLSLSHVVYETHDESPLLMRLRAKLSWIPDSGWLVFNQHFQMVLLVMLGLLPPQWLCCVTAAYPVAKIGVARGALSRLGTSASGAVRVPSAVERSYSIPLRSRTLRVAMSAIRTAGAGLAVVAVLPKLLFKTGGRFA